MRLPVIATLAHKGKALEIDYERETITVRGAHGEILGTLTWADLIERAQDAPPPPAPEPYADARSTPRASLVLRVKYAADGGRPVESRAGGVGGGGMFIETESPFPVGTELALSFTLPDRPKEWLDATATVAWVCPKPDQYTFSTGMGMQFVKIAPDTRKRIVDLVNAMRRAPTK